jgi:hypothetical protein
MHGGVLHPELGGENVVLVLTIWPPALAFVKCITNGTSGHTEAWKHAE